MSVTKIYKKLDFFEDKTILFAIVDQANVRTKHPQLFKKMYDYTFTKTSRVANFYQNHIKYFDSIDMAMSYASRYDFVLIQSVGNLIKFNILLEHLKSYYDANPEFYMVAFTLDWESERGTSWIECHHQMMFINVPVWKKCGSPEYGNWESVTEELPNYSRSEENFHDKYTPYWIKGEPGTTLKTRTAQGWGFIKAGLSNGLRIDNFTKEMRDCRLYLYPETDSDKLYQATLDRDWNNLSNPNQKKWIRTFSNPIPIWVFNSENYRFELDLRFKKTYFGPAAGFKYLDILAYNATRTTFIFYDYNQLSLDWIENLKENWNGENYSAFLKKQDAKFRENYKFVQGTPEENEEFLYKQFGGPEEFKKLWTRFKNAKALFIKCDLYNLEELKILLNETENEDIFFYYSNIFSTDFIFLEYTLEQVSELHKAFVKTIFDRYPKSSTFGTNELGQWQAKDNNSVIGANLVIADENMNYSFIDTETAHTTDKNQWYGWKCSVGFQSIYIDFDGGVWRGTCRVGGYVGNVNVPTGWDHYITENDWVTCTYKICSCGADMNAPKVKNESSIKKFFPQFTSKKNLKLLNAVPIDQLTPEIVFSKDYNKHKQIIWDIGRRCNFDCWYCNPNSHNNYETQKNLDMLTSAYNNLNKFWIKDRRTKFSFTGGEPAVYKDFMPFIKMLVEKEHIVSTTTNTSATPEYYYELAKYSNITFSIHLRYVEKFGLKKFTDAVAGAVKSVIDSTRDGTQGAGNWLGVRIMMEPNYQPLAEECFKEFKKLFPSVNVAVQGLHNPVGQHEIKIYKKEEIDWLVEANKL